MIARGPAPFTASPDAVVPLLRRLIWKVAEDARQDCVDRRSGILHRMLRHAPLCETLPDQRVGIGVDEVDAQRASFVIDGLEAEWMKARRWVEVDWILSRANWERRAEARS